MPKVAATCLIIACLVITPAARARPADPRTVTDQPADINKPADIEKHTDAEKPAYAERRAGSDQSDKPVAATGKSAPPAPTSGDAKIDNILDRLESRGRVIHDLKAAVRKEHTDVIPVPETRAAEGVLWFRRLEPNSRFKVRFDRFLEGGIVRDQPRDVQTFVFDGVWFTEKNEKTQRVIRRQVVAEGERINPFKVGQGPFPLPFGQSRADMLENFDIKLAPPAKGDPPGTDHLVCTPKTSSTVVQDYRVAHFFIDGKLELPVRIDAERRKDEAIIRVHFSDIVINSGIPGSEFEMPVPQGYALTEEPLPSRAER